MRNKIKKSRKQSCIVGKIPNLPYKPTQEEMIKLAMQDIKMRKKGKYKLVYDKATKTITAEEVKSVSH